MSARADKAARNDGDPALGMDTIAIATLFLQLLPQVLPIFALCKKQPPAPTPVPATLASAGVTQETWNQANGAKFAAEQSKGNHGGFSHISVNQTAIQIAKAKGIKKNAAKPMAVSALQTGLDEPVEAIAQAMTEAKANSSAIMTAFHESNPV